MNYPFGGIFPKWAAKIKHFFGPAKFLDENFKKFRFIRNPSN